jgi:hypothetical protein
MRKSGEINMQIRESLRLRKRYLLDQHRNATLFTVISNLLERCIADLACTYKGVAI